MGKIYINNKSICDIPSNNVQDTILHIANLTGLTTDSLYLEQNGRRCEDSIDVEANAHCIIRVLGGKGGFGSMLRAIGAQIEKTTNREACRDLSGRRLRDINEEKRLKAWLDKQNDREREAEERKKRKIEKLLAVPKHDFKDAQYEEARSKLTEKVNDAVEEGFKKAESIQQDNEGKKITDEKSALKRKGVASSNKSATAAKKKKGALWIDDDLSDTDSSSSDTSEDESSNKVAIKN